MKKRLFTALFLAALAAAALAGCGSSASSVSGTSAPALNNEPSISNTPAMSEDGDATPEMTYYEDAHRFPELRFSAEPGDYTEPFVLNIEGADGETVYYTTDGSDPVYYTEYELEIRGDRLQTNSLSMGEGMNNLRFQMLDRETGAVSPVITARYRVRVPFDTTSRYIDQDSFYEYRAANYYNSAKLFRRSLKTGEEEQLDEFSSVDRLTVMGTHSTKALSLGEDYARENYMNPEAILQWEEHMDDPVEYTTVGVTYGERMLIFRVFDGEIFDGERFDLWNTSYSYRVGDAWLVTRNDEMDLSRATWSDDFKEPVGTEETALWCDLMTDEVAIKCGRNAGVSGVYAKDPDGSNQRTLWRTKENISLDAVIRDKLFYHTIDKDYKTDQHFVYDLVTGEHRVNTLVPEKMRVLGYTTSGVYVEGGDRLPLDYDTVAGELVGEMSPEPN